MNHFPIFLCVCTFQQPHLCFTKLFKIAFSSLHFQMFLHVQVLTLHLSTLMSIVLQCSGVSQLASLSSFSTAIGRETTQKLFSLPFWASCVFFRRAKRKETVSGSVTTSPPIPPMEAHSFANIAAFLEVHPNSPSSPQQKKAPTSKFRA